MERDGFTNSLWQMELDPYPSAERFPQADKIYDVVIVGGGITGLSLGLILQEKGMSCILIEAHQIGLGTTGGTTAHINTFLETPYHSIAKQFSDETAARVARLVQDAIGRIRYNISHYAIDCQFSMAPGYIYAQTERQEHDLHEIITYSNRIGVDALFTDQFLFPIPYGLVGLFPNQAEFHPLLYIYGLAKAFEEKGGTLIQYCRMEKMISKKPVVLQTNLGDIHAKQAVFATHTPPGVNILHTLIAPYRSYVLGIPINGSFELPGLVYDMNEPYHYFRTAIFNQKKYLLVGGEDHKTGHNENTKRAYRKLQSYLMKYFSADAVEFHWSSQLYTPADGLAYIGEMPGEPDNIFVATGFGGNGMIYSHISAILLTDLITKGYSENESVFSPKRVKPIAAFSNFIKENADVVKEIITGYLPKEKMAMIDLAPEEGRVIEFEGKKMGVYRDINGAVFAVNPVCPHMKCIVHWNNTEKSWDCPCHGSRFSFTGELLTGPAKHDLQVYTLTRETSK